MRASTNSKTGRKRPETWRLEGTEKVPHLPYLCFPEFGMMMEEAGISSRVGGGTPASVHAEDVDVGASPSESLASRDRHPSRPLDLHDNDDGGWEGSEQPTKDRLDIYRPTSDDSEGRQMGEEDEAPPEMSHEHLRPVTGLGWYEDDESLSTVDHCDSRSSVCESDGSAENITAESHHLPAQQDPLRCSPFVRCRSPASSSSEAGDTPTTEENKPGKPSQPMSTVIKNTNRFFQSNTEDDDWLGPRPAERASVSYEDVKSSSTYTEPSCNPILDDSNPVSPTSRRSTPISIEEQEIDDLLDIYATSPDRTSIPSTTPVRHDDLPPYPPYHPSASGPLLTIAHGLSLPRTISFDDLQEHLARNANILRYLVLHCIPSPSINPIEYITDLVEPVLPPPLPTHPSLAQNYPSHPRRREYTRLLQAVRSVLWSANAINDMLAVVDFDPSSPVARVRPSTALPMFRKLRTADAQRKGCLTSAQLHRLHRHGVSLLDVLQMNDVPKIVARGLSERFVEAAESGVLEVAKEGNLLDEEGALLELLVDPDDTDPKSPGGERRGWLRGGSGLRICVGVDEDNGETTDGESKGSAEEAFDGPLVEDGNDGHEADYIPYTVSPLSPEANPGEGSWDHQDVSPLTTSCRLQDLETLFHEARAPPPEQERPADETTPPDRSHETLRRRTRMLRTCGDRGGVVFDEETAKSPEMQRFFHEIGAAPPAVVSGSDAPEDPAAAREVVETAGRGNEDARLAGGDRRSWGVGLGGGVERLDSRTKLPHGPGIEARIQAAVIIPGGKRC
ncbi:hypothetical protein LZ30DRAFT_274813 [Colletotrichum cereale]|nr:hypothetical protein LZ30DRAFT_274813 [Colletotrichum cereale]